MLASWLAILVAGGTLAKQNLARDVQQVLTGLTRIDQHASSLTCCNQWVRLNTKASRAPRCTCHSRNVVWPNTSDVAFCVALLLLFVPISCPCSPNLPSFPSLRLA
eukprot:gnl/MRDRNA2_/MRDRNA2_221245_c0_seq1.p1 gnl/MRDRNA2_/MRDRNA2_221245_c0~~gnl/MRDRNA2_/MRDRNA2_221245_c0_seq1.p1  ORF type:complete len:106 (-),score=5.26 gnl/MRDRNA2_/MRDRNA2_221245_c0_seq1:374-691(-)